MTSKEEAIKNFTALTRNEQLTRLRKEAIACANTDGEFPGDAMFKRPGVRDCLPLQEEIIRLATSYADMVLYKDVFPDKLPETNYELGLWNAHAREALGKFTPEITQYCAEYIKPSQDGKDDDYYKHLAQRSLAEGKIVDGLYGGVIRLAVHARYNILEAPSDQRPVCKRCVPYSHEPEDVARARVGPPPAEVTYSDAKDKDRVENDKNFVNWENKVAGWKTKIVGDLQAIETSRAKRKDREV